VTLPGWRTWVRLDRPAAIEATSCPCSKQREGDHHERASKLSEQGVRVLFRLFDEGKTRRAAAKLKLRPARKSADGANAMH
jgi:hypothetical protein